MCYSFSLVFYSICTVCLLSNYIPGLADYGCVSDEFRDINIVYPCSLTLQLQSPKMRCNHTNAPCNPLTKTVTRIQAPN